MADSTGTPRDVLSWLKLHGGSYNEEVFGLEQFEGMGWGGIALQDIEPDTTLFTIPDHLLLSISNGRVAPLFEGAAQPSLGDAWEGLGGPSGGWPALILTLMYEHAVPGSKWETYIRHMPEMFNTPMFWTEQELRELKGTDVLDKIGKAQADEDYQTKIAPLLANASLPFSAARQSAITSTSRTPFSLDDYHCQASRILSRSFTVTAARAGRQRQRRRPTEGDANAMRGQEGEGAEEDEEDSDDEEEEEEQVMVPLADMLNAAYGRDNARIHYAEGCLMMITTEAIAKGEQIYNTYGSPPNADLLRKYGHVDAYPLPEEILASLPESARVWPYGNEGDMVDITGDVVLEEAAGQLGANKDSLMERIDWWLDEEEQEDTFSLTFTPDGTPPAIISFVRLLLLSQPDWESARDKGKLPKPRLSWGDDGKQVAQVIEAVIEKRLAGYPGSVEADCAYLQTFGDRPSLDRRYCATVVRLGERRVLLSALHDLRAQRQAALTANESTGTKRGREEQDGSNKRQHV